MKVNPALNRLRIQPFAPGINRDELVSQVEEALENPDKVDQGLHPHMCVPAVLQSYLAQTDPEEFVELVGELASPEGVAETASGHSLFRIEDSLLDDGTDRNLMERLVQAAIFDGAERAAGALRGSYSSLNHTHDGVQASGLGTWQTQEMLRQLTNDPTWTKSNPDSTVLDRACDEEPIPVVLKTGKGRGHQMLLTDITDGVVTLRDPEGEFATPFEGSKLDGKGHQIMPVEAFEKVFEKAYLKSEQLPPEFRDPSTWMMG